MRDVWTPYALSLRKVHCVEAQLVESGHTAVRLPLPTRSRWQIHSMLG